MAMAMAVVTNILPAKKEKAFTSEGEGTATHRELRRRLATALAPAAFSNTFYIFREFAHILWQYKTLFPEAYAASTAKTTVPARLIPALQKLCGYSSEDGEIPFSEKEQEFFVLVSNECFEYDIEVFMDNALQGERMITIPLLSQALETNDCDLSDFRFGIQLVMLLLGIWDIDQLEEEDLIVGHYGESRSEKAIEAERASYYQIAKKVSEVGRATFSYEQFSILCTEYVQATGNYVINTALLAMGFVQQDTGNTFLDYDTEYMLTEMDATWDAPVIRSLAKEWKEAELNQAVLSKFFAWLEESSENYRHLVWLFNAACDQEISVSVREDLLGLPGAMPEGRPLYEVLV